MSRVQYPGLAIVQADGWRVAKTLLSFGRCRRQSWPGRGSTLGSQTYLTAGPKEARTWTIHQGATAPQAAGVIHTDFERGFIKAEIVHFDDLMAAGSMAVAVAKAADKVRMEGKDYVMHDGDVVEFRFNVNRRVLAGQAGLPLLCPQGPHEFPSGVLNRPCSQSLRIRAQVVGEHRLQLHLR